MPTYSYKCTACGNKFDQFQKFADDPLTECPECQGLIKRVLQPVGVVFKGSGWYINDSRKPESNGTDSKPAEKTATEKTSADKSAPEKSSTEAAPVAKSETAEPAKVKAPATADV